MYFGRIIPENATGNDPYYNLALEHAILDLHNINNFQSTIRFWRNSKTVILGRNQDINGEINIDYCSRNKINIARRMSGGGAVYQDLGNVNVSFFINKKLIPSNLTNIKTITGYFTEHVARSLRNSGLEPIDVKNTSNILYKDLKISGSAGYNKSKWILHHFTLLMDTNLTDLNKSLLARPGYTVKKGRESNYMKTTNLPQSFVLANWKKVFEQILHEELNINFKTENLDLKEHEYAKKLEVSFYKTKTWIIDKIRPDLNQI